MFDPRQLSDDELRTAAAEAKSRFGCGHRWDSQRREGERQLASLRAAFAALANMKGRSPFLVFAFSNKLHTWECPVAAARLKNLNVRVAALEAEDMLTGRWPVLPHVMTAGEAQLFAAFPARLCPVCRPEPVSEDRPVAP